MKKILSVAMVAFFAVTVPALAGIDEGNGEIGFNYGNTSYDDPNPGVALDSSNDLSVRGGYFMTRMFEIEGQFINTDTNVKYLGINVGDAQMNMLMVNGVFNFHPHDKIVPYALVGVGHANVDATGTSGDSSLAYQFGGGTRWFVGKTGRAALRFDVSFVTEDTQLDPTNNTGDKTHTTVAGGFSWRLGR